MCTRLRLSPSISLHSRKVFAKMSVSNKAKKMCLMKSNHTKSIITALQSGLRLSFSTPNDRFLRNIFNGSFIHVQSFCQKSTARK